MSATAKIFKNGRSQAVRLPKAYRLKGNTVSVRREGDRVILEPMEKSKWSDGFWDIFTPDPDFEVPDSLPAEPFSLE